ncbi:MAG: hypothetical protein C5B55_05360 [Blastocatellia bacterium]|nr:MAG: hypothetical protein C5B55_05360 [Blastocatellia bacterium]
MESETRALLGAWENFNVIVGSSGAALTGLQFVVIALVADLPRRSTSREIQAFGTPNIVHFGAVLFIAAILSAPWERMVSVSLFLAACGLFGIVYVMIVWRRAGAQTAYKPVMEDWMFHVILPFIAYGSVFAASLFLGRFPRRMLFIVAAAMLLLLFIGIHNAWDTVTFIATGQHENPAKHKSAKHEHKEKSSRD